MIQFKKNSISGILLTLLILIGCDSSEKTDALATRALSITHAPAINGENMANYLIQGICTGKATQEEEVPSVSVTLNEIDAGQAPCTEFTWELTVNTSALLDGDNIRIAITEGEEEVEQFVIKDTTSPEIVVTSELVINNGNQANFELGGTCNEEGREISITIDGLSAETSSCNGTWSIAVDSALNEGSATVTITQTDNFGNEQTITLILVKDITASQPTFESNLDINGGNYLIYRATGTCPEDGMVRVTVDTNTPEDVSCTGGAWMSSEYQFTSGEVETVTLRATLTDEAGNMGTEITKDVAKNTNTRMITIDTPSPINAANQSNYPVSGSCSTHNGIVTVTVGGQSPDSAPSCTSNVWNTTVDVQTVADHPTVAINASFGSGGDITEDNSTALKDISIPALTITTPSAITSNSQDSYSVSGTCTEVDQQIQVNIGGIALNVDCVSNAWSITGQDVKSLTGGSVRITANTKDIAGNIAPEVAEDVTRDIDPPVLSITTSDINIDQSNYQDYSLMGGCEGTRNVSITIGNLPEEVVPCSSGAWSLANRDMTALEDGTGIVVIVGQNDDYDNQGEFRTTLDKDIVPSVPTFAEGSSNNGTDSSVTLEIDGDETPTDYTFYHDNSCSLPLSSTISGSEVTLTGFVPGNNIIYFEVAGDTTCYESVSYLYVRETTIKLEKISTKYAHTCVIKNGGGVLCWGLGTNGRLGNDAALNKDHPVDVVDGNGSTTPLLGIAQIGAGDYHTCALKSNGGVVCWGNGTLGELGNDASIHRDHPVTVVDGDGSTTPLSGIVQVNAGGYHSCALKNDGGVLCWGYGGFGQLGNDASSNRDHPVAVVDGNGSTIPFSGIVQVSLGDHHSCALKSDGGVLCWGYGGNAQLGNDASFNRSYPVTVVDGDGSTTPLSGIVQISSGGNHTCALKSNGGVVCWGYGENGQLGNDASSTRDHPVAVVDGNGSTTPLSGIELVSSGSTHTCALKSDGGILCWGFGAFGQLGNDASSTRDHPVAVVDGNGSTTPLSGIELVSSGSAHTCALKSDGGILCWGSGINGRLGNDASSNRDHPVAVVDGDGSSTALNIEAPSLNTYTCADDGSAITCSLGS